MKKFLTFVLIVFVLAILPIMVVHAAPVSAPVYQETIPVIPSFPDLVKTLESLTGVGLFFSALANSLKSLGWLKDGQAPTASLIMNTLAIVGLVLLQITKKTDLIPIIDSSAGILSTILTAVIALVYQLYISRKGHEKVLSGMPVIGTSFAGRMAGDTVLTELPVVKN